MMRALVLSLAALPILVGATMQNAQRAKPSPTAFAPIGYFNRQCFYCHSRDGASYDANSLRKYTDKQLLAKLVEMTDDKARAPLSDRELDVLASWFRSLGKQEPFVVWTASKDGTFTFEATKGATLTASSGSFAFDKDKWVLTGAKSNESPIVTATLGKKKTVLRLAEASYSHVKVE